MSSTEEFEKRLKSNVFQGFKNYAERVVELFEKGETEQLNESIKLIENVFENCSKYKKRLLVAMISCQPVLQTILIEFQLRTSGKSNYLLNVDSYLNVEEPHKDRRQHTQAKGNNRAFNLGVISDGSPVEEFRTVEVPECRDIKMSNNHTLFLTYDGRLMACGKESNFSPNFAEDQCSTFVTLPLLINFPDVIDGQRESFLYVEAKEHGSILISETSIYFIGKFPFLNNPLINKQSLEKVGENCWRIQHEEPDINDINFQEEPPLFAVKLIYTKFGYNFVEYQECVLKLDKNRYLIRVSFDYCKLGWSLVDVPGIHDNIYVSINGIDETDCSIKSFNLLPNGEILLHSSNGVLYKGVLKFRKNPENSYQTPNGKFKDILESQIYAEVQEVAGTYGYDLFASSPDGANIILQASFFSGENSEDDSFQMKTRSSSTLEKLKRVNCNEAKSYEDLKHKIKELMKMTTDAQNVEKPNNKYAMMEIEICLDYLEYIFSLNVHQKSFQYNRQELWDDVNSIKYNDIEEVKSENDDSYYEDIETGTLEEMLESYESFNEIINDGLHLELSDTEVFLIEIIDTFLNYIKEQMVNLFNVNYSGHYPVEDSFYNYVQAQFFTSFKSENVKQIFEKRVKMGDLDEDDIEMDFQPNIFNGKLKTNEKLFKLAYPTIYKLCAENKYSELISFYIRSKRQICYSSSYKNIKLTLDGKLISVGEVEKICTAENGGKVESFVTDDMGKDEIWIIETNDGKEIPCYKNLLILHSIQIAGKRRFENMSCGIEGNKAENYRLKIDFHSKIVLKALNALLDMTTIVYDRMEEIIEVLFFFDYFCMEEAKEDIFQIIFCAANSLNIHHIYNLYQHYPNQILLGFLRRPSWFLFTVPARQLPPFELIKRFSEINFSNVTSISKKWSQNIFDNLSDEEIIENFVDLENDFEEFFWKHLEEESGRDFTHFKMLAAEKRKMKNEKRKKPRNYSEGSVVSTNKESVERFRNSSFCDSPTSSAQKPNVNLEKSPISPEDFPESPISLSIPLKKNRSSNGRFAPTGAKFRRFDEQTDQPSVSSWGLSGTTLQTNGMINNFYNKDSLQSFLKIVEEEQKLDDARNGRNRVVQPLPYVEMEVQAEQEIKETFRRDTDKEALITVEVMAEKDEEKAEPMWGKMPGLFKKM